MLKVYAIVLNYNSSDECIGLFKNLSQYNQSISEILIIDNASSIEDIENLKKNIPLEKLIFNSENLGFAGGNNIAIQKALTEKADFIWILNPDIRIDEDTLPQLLNIMAKDDSLAAIGPRIIKREDPYLIFSDGEKIIRDASCRTCHKNHNKLVEEIPGSIDYDVDYIDGSCILIRKEAFEEIGLFCEDYFLYFEETDWCFRSKKKGWKLAVNSNAKSYNLTSNKTALFHFYMMRNRMIFSKKFFPFYREVKRHYLKLLVQEVFDRLKGTYLKPFFISRLKGLFSGIFYKHIRN